MKKGSIVNHSILPAEAVKAFECGRRRRRRQRRRANFERV